MRRPVEENGPPIDLSSLAADYHVNPDPVAESQVGVAIDPPKLDGMIVDSIDSTDDKEKRREKQESALPRYPTPNPVPNSLCRSGNSENGNRELGDRYLNNKFVFHFDNRESIELLTERKFGK